MIWKRKKARRKKIQAAPPRTLGTKTIDMHGEKVKVQILSPRASRGMSMSFQPTTTSPKHVQRRSSKGRQR